MLYHLHAGATRAEDDRRAAALRPGALAPMEAPHGAAPMDGVQFHPESFLTTEGPKLLDNFLKMA
ncbi:MAG: hypothetical protein EBR07_02165 [Planctomycetes bacterium]|nr:hypothetical protein [Planctomycetota bacterium]